MASRVNGKPVKTGVPARIRLTDYESDQVRQIAVWKAQPPNPFAEIFHRITAPGVKLVEKVIPDSLVRAAIERSFDLAEKLAGKNDVKRQAGVRALHDLRKKPLEECDHLALQTGRLSHVYAVAEGAATGAGGIWTTLIDIPLLFILALRTVLRTGYCYGFPLDRRDRHFIIAVMTAAISGIPEMRRKRLDEIHELEDRLIEGVQEDLLSEELLSILFQLEIFESVPGIGAISGAVINLAFMHRVAATAHRVFQERWLRDNGKVRSIAAAPLHARDLAVGWAGAIQRATYSSCYAAGFGVALPVCLLTSLFGPGDNAITPGVRNGAQDAGEQIDRVLGSRERKVASRRLARGRRAGRLALA